MMKFRDEQGNVVTPRKGDYVLASDIKDEDMHNQVCEAFGTAGCDISGCGGLYGRVFAQLNSIRWTASGRIQWDVSIGGRRIIPTQQTLFEAACEAEDGARFKVACCTGSVLLKGGILTWNDENGPAVNIGVMGTVHFEQIPSGPKKRDVEMLFVRGEEVPKDMYEEACKAIDIMGRLMQWEGAQIGKPGYVMTSDPHGWWACFSETITKDRVTFQTAEQCEAAWRDVCPEMWNGR